MKTTSLSKVSKMQTGKLINGNEFNDMEEKVSTSGKGILNFPQFLALHVCSHLNRSAKQA